MHHYIRRHPRAYISMERSLVSLFPVVWLTFPGSGAGANPCSLLLYLIGVLSLCYWLSSNRPRCHRQAIRFRSCGLERLPLLIRFWNPVVFLGPPSLAAARHITWGCVSLLTRSSTFAPLPATHVAACIHPGQHNFGMFVTAKETKANK